MRYSLSNQIGQSNGNDVKNMKCYIHTFSTGSPHSCIQLTGLQVPYMCTPQSQASDTGEEPGTYLPRRTGVVKDAYSSFQPK